MPRLISVHADDGPDDDDDNHHLLIHQQLHLKKRQLLLDVDDMRSMIVEFDEPLASISRSSTTIMSLAAFERKVAPFVDDSSLQISYEQFCTVLSQNVACIGCRRCVEKIFHDICNQSSFDPIFVHRDDKDANYIVSVCPSISRKSVQLHRCIVANFDRCRQLVDNLTKCKKNRRCHLHSIDNQLYRTVGLSWQSLWDAMSTECREECCIIESDSLLEMLESYLLKHRFCPDCKCTLMRAYRCLIGDVDVSKEKGYNARLFQGLRYCNKEGHLHIKPRVVYLDSLVHRAETELASNSRERHAKTLEIGQLEVLTCLGLFLHGRLARMSSALKCLETGYQLFYCTATMALFSNLMTKTDRSLNAIDESFDKLCAELQMGAAIPHRSAKVTNKKKTKRISKSEKVHTDAATCHAKDTIVDEDNDDVVDTKSTSDAGYISRECSPPCSLPPLYDATVAFVSTASINDWSSDYLITTSCGGGSCQISQAHIDWFNSSTVSAQREALRKRLDEQYRALQTRLLSIA